MTNLADAEQVKALQANLRATLETPQGKEVLSFLEEICGWYDFKETDREAILIAHGKRQVLATLKTLMKYKAEEVAALARVNE